LVEVTRTGPFKKLIWAPTKDPENERQEIHDRRKDPHPPGSGWNGSQDPGGLPGTVDQRTDVPSLDGLNSGCYQSIRFG
jgi:hypothetical protein